MTEVRLADAALRPMLERLSVRADQDHLVAPNDITFRQAATEGGSAVYGLLDAGTPVGLMALIDMGHPQAELDADDPTDAIYVWRLMVDANHQGQGHGSAAMAFAHTLAASRGRAQVLLSVVPEDQSALPFYEGLGFTRTGRVIDNEVEMSKPVLG